MFRPLRTRRTRWVAAAAALTMLGAGVVAATPAHAASRYEDGFEGNPYLRWKPDYQHGSSLVNLINNVQARPDNGGIWSAWFDAPSAVPARISSAPILVDPPSTGPAVCSADAWVKKAGPGAHADGNPRVRLGIRAASTAGIFLDISTYTIENTDYKRAAFATYTYEPNRPVVVEISVTGGMAFVDDVTVHCVNPPR